MQATAYEGWDRVEPTPDPTVNRVELVGYVGATPELRYAASDTPVVRFSVATRHYFDEGDGIVQTTDWHQIVVFGQAGEACRRFSAGTLVQVSGRLHTRSWVDRRHVRHTKTEIIADRVRATRPPVRQPALPLQATVRMTA